MSRTSRARLIALWGLLAALSVDATPNAARQTQITRQTIEDLLKQAYDRQSAGAQAEMEALGRTAMTQAKTSGHPDLQVRAMIAIASALFIQSRLSESLAIAREAEPIAISLADRTLRARVWNSIALNLRELGEFEEAAAYFWRGLDLQRAAGNHLEQSRVLRNLAMLHSMLGDFVAAEDLAREAHTQASAAGDAMFQQLTLTAVGIQQMWQGRQGDAIATFRRAQAAAVGARSPAIDGEVLLNIAVAEFQRGNFETSQATARAALALTKEYPAAQALMRSLLGRAALKLGRPREAMDLLMAANQEWKALGEAAHRYYVLEADVWMVRAMRALGNASGALALNQRLLTELEQTYGRVALDENSRATARASLSGSYVEAIDMLFALGRVEEAFDLSERYRARAFIESMTEWRGGAAATLTVEDRRREQDLAQQISGFQRSLWSMAVTDPGRAALELSLSRLEQDRDTFRRTMRQKNPRLAELRYPSLRTAAAHRAASEAGTVTLAFVLGEERSFVWAISARGLSAALLPARVNIDRSIERFTKAIAARPAIGRAVSASTLDTEARSLYRMLLGPVETALAGANRLVVVPDGSLHHVPFEALKQRDGAYLVQRFSVSVTPSLTALAALEEAAPPSGGHTLLAFADPSSTAHSVRDAERRSGSRRELTALPFTRTETRAIASTFGRGAARVYVGAAAGEGALKREPLADYRYIHFATHAYTDDIRPGRSVIVLSLDAGKTDDGLLQPAEIMALRLNADLVTLSACGTGLGRIHNGEGIVGLSRAFFYAGARSVTASLWNVNDAATAALMKKYYGELTNGSRKDDALRVAKLAMMASKDRAHPYYWAPFVLLGSAR